MTTGERIKLVRKQQNMNQGEFAKEIGVSTTTICQLEIGKYSISRVTKRNLCLRFHVNEEWLDTGEGEMYTNSNTAEEIIPELIEILNKNASLLNAMKQAINMMTLADWKKLNAFIASLEE